MGLTQAAPINEAVFLLDSLNRKEFERVRADFPRLAGELVLGRAGGTAEESDSLDRDRAEFMLVALGAVSGRATSELVRVRQRIGRARRFRLSSQIIGLICTSGVLAAVAIDQKATSVITAVLALAASAGVMIAESQEGLLDAASGKIYEAYDKASQAVYKGELMSANLRLLLNHPSTTQELRDAIAAANALCEELNRWVIQTSGSS